MNEVQQPSEGDGRVDVNVEDDRATDVLAMVLHDIGSIEQVDILRLLNTKYSPVCIGDSMQQGNSRHLFS
jgi:hypothetical protein